MTRENSMSRRALDRAKDAVLFTRYIAAGLSVRAARGVARGARRGLKRMRTGTAGQTPRRQPATVVVTARRKGPLWRRLAIWGAAALVIYGAAAWVGVQVGDYVMEGEEFQPPALEDQKFKLASRVLAADGEPVYTFAEENRDYVKYEDISPWIVQGLVAVEDEQFWEHRGINKRGIARAVVHDLEASAAAGHLVFPEGGSSITQQLAKQLFLNGEKKLSRKIPEALYAVHIERNYTKKEILEAYLNKVYLGHQRYGVEAAAQFYFGKHAKELSLSQAALLAGLPVRPTGFSPRTNPEGAIKRRNHVLDRMAVVGYITRADAKAAEAEPLAIVSVESQKRLETQQAAPYFVEEVRRQLMEKPETSSQISTGGLEIETTLDMALQRKATQAVREGLRKLDKQLRGWKPIERNLTVEGIDPDAFEDPLWQLPPAADNVMPGVVLEVSADAATVRIGADRVKLDRGSIAWTKHRDLTEVLHRGDVTPFRLGRRDASGTLSDVTLEQDPLLEGALVAIDVASGEIVAMVGGYDYNRSEFNKATQAWRQAGSSFKPIYYATALESGLRPSTTAMDEPTQFIDSWSGQTYEPENYHKDYKGRVTLREALELSLNIPSVRLLNYVGYGRAIETARKFGITAKLQPYPSMALGAQEMTLMEMTSAFGAFPNQGLHVDPTVLRRVRDAKGNVLFEHVAQGQEVISPQTAFQMVQLMRGVIQNGTAKDARVLGHQLAGKTGTTDDYTDAWFIGFTPSLVVGVWAGYEQEVKTIGRDYSGARAALPIWIDFMRSVLEGRPEEQFADPGGVDFVPIDRTTGLIASEDCPRDSVILEAFQSDNKPLETCSAGRHRRLSLPRCLQRFGMDDSGVLVVPDESALFALEETPDECPITVDPIQRAIEYHWSPGAEPTGYAYRVGFEPEGQVQEDSIESLMMADRRTMKRGDLSDFDVVDGKTVIIVRNDGRKR